MSRLVPRALGGTEHENNLVAACERCDVDKGDTIAIPSAMCAASENDEGWTTWKTWGRWRLYWNESTAYLDYGNDRYPIDLRRVHESDWVEHCRSKAWPPEMFADFCAGLEFARTLVRA
jgi:hypothetical protein